MSKLIDEMGERLVLFLQVPHDQQDLHQFIENEIKRTIEADAEKCESMPPKHNALANLAAYKEGCLDCAARIRKLLEDE